MKRLTIGMKCTKCRILKELGNFWDYDTNNPICIPCERMNLKKINKSVTVLVDIKIKPIIFETKQRIENIKKIKERKNKKQPYPKEFSLKRRKLLWDARKNDWCTACGTKELLQVHHIDRDKFNNDDSNLLVLCFYCHAKEHKHMQWKKPAKWFR